jgi:hypothetical protein
MHQTNHIETKLQMFKLEMNKTLTTPLEASLKITKEMFLQIESEKKT